MKRIGLLLILALMVLSGCAAPAPEPPVVAVLLANDVRLPKVDGLREGLAELGYPAGAVQLELYSARGDRSVLPLLAARAVAGKPAILVAGGGVEAVALSQANAAGIPTVLMGVASSVRTGLVGSLIRPGGAITGLDNQHAELSAKRLELLTMLLPDVKRVLLIYDPLVIPGAHAREVTEEAAARLGIVVAPLQAETEEQAIQGLARIQPGEYDAALLLPAFVLESAVPRMAAEFERLRLPVMGPLEMQQQAGLLAAYGVSLEDQGRQSARFVVKLLQRQSPAAIPVETPDNPELVVDTRIAERLGVKLSPVGLAFARLLHSEAGDRR